MLSPDPNDEFTFRFPRSKSRSRGKLFYRLVERAVAVAPVSDKSLGNCSREEEL